MKMTPVLYIAFWSGVAVTSLLSMLLSNAQRNVEAFYKYEPGLSIFFIIVFIILKRYSKTREK
ncbi:MAG: hypothetical protein M3Z92_07945 [Bacteroidota bacterium]|nr:hypothetical protein [Bacteroidota bacterium]